MTVPVAGQAISQVSAVPAQSTFQQASAIVAQFFGLAILAATLAAIAAIVYRWYVHEIVPAGLALLVGLSGVAVYLNTMTVLGDVIGGDVAPTELEVALFNIAAFLFGVGGAFAGRHAGDRFATDVLVNRSVREIDTDVSRLVQTVGRVITVQIPEEIDDAVGYDPITAQTREKLVGTEFVFPRNLTVEELRGRLVARLKSDYAVGHVDIKLTDDGSIERLALGSRAAGIGPTLPPATNAVAVRADPAFSASSGDLVQLWETDPMRRVLTAELRGIADGVVTIAINAADTPKVDPTRRYRLVTLPVEDRPEREFASLLRAADETFSAVTVKAGSPLHGMVVGALSPTIVAVTPEGGAPAVLPDAGRVLEPGDLVSAIATPDALRRLELAAEPLDPGLVQNVPEAANQPPDTASPGPTGDVQTGDKEPAPEATEEHDPEPSRETAGSEPWADTPATEPGPDSEMESGTETGTEPRERDDTEPDEGGDTDDEPDDEPVVAGKADGTSFEALKADFDSGEADWDDTSEESTEGDDADGQSAGGASSFQQLKSEFDSGEADWAKTDDEGGDGSEDDRSSPDLDDEESGLDVGEDDLSTLDFDDEDGSGLDFGTGDESDSTGFSFEDDEEDDNGNESEKDDDAGGSEREDDKDGGEDTEEDEKADDTEDSEADGDSGADDGGDDDDSDEESDGGSGGGATSFQQLKAEFESGEADWDDDISDSPGGDMRLDE